jgi:hypothetical protein
VRRLRGALPRRDRPDPPKYGAIQVATSRGPQSLDRTPVQVRLEDRSRERRGPAIRDAEDAIRRGSAIPSATGTAGIIRPRRGLIHCADECWR